MQEFTQKELQALRHIRNSIAHRGRTPSVRELMEALGYKSPRSAQDLLAQLTTKNAVKKLASGEYQLLRDAARTKAHEQTVDVPIIGVVAAGMPILAEENIEGFIPISTSLARSGAQHFLLLVKGDSMDKAGINNGDFVLVRQQSTADPGQNVVALIDGEATVKTFSRSRDVVVLKPQSTNPAHQPIILDHDFQIQGIVIRSIHNLH
jgi:repressor LexA